MEPQERTEVQRTERMLGVRSLKQDARILVLRSEGMLGDMVLGDIRVHRFGTKDREDAGS